MFCRQCGQENPDNASTCQACGAVLQSATSQGTAAVKAKTSGMAIASLVFGISSIFLNWLLLLPSILAIILGHIAQVKIKRSRGALSGTGLVIGGLATGYSVLALYLLLGAIAVPAYQEYVYKARVAEVTIQTAAYRAAIDRAVAEGKTLEELPTDPAALGLESKDNYLTMNIADIQLGSRGRITVVLSNRSRLGKLAGKTLVYVPRLDEGNVRWQLDETSTVPRKYWLRGGSVW